MQTLEAKKKDYAKEKKRKQEFKEALRECEGERCALEDRAEYLELLVISMQRELQRSGNTLYTNKDDDDDEGCIHARELAVSSQCVSDNVRDVKCVDDVAMCERESGGSNAEHAYVAKDSHCVGTAEYVVDTKIRERESVVSNAEHGDVAKDSHCVGDTECDEDMKVCEHESGGSSSDSDGDSERGGMVNHCSFSSRRDQSIHKHDGLDQDGADGGRGQDESESVHEGMVNQCGTSSRRVEGSIQKCDEDHKDGRDGGRRGHVDAESRRNTDTDMHVSRVHAHQLNAAHVRNQDVCSNVSGADVVSRNDSEGGTVEQLQSLLQRMDDMSTRFSVCVCVCVHMRCLCVCVCVVFVCVCVCVCVKRNG